MCDICDRAVSRDPWVWDYSLSDEEILELYACHAFGEDGKYKIMTIDHRGNPYFITVEEAKRRNQEYMDQFHLE